MPPINKETGIPEFDIKRFFAEIISFDEDWLGDEMLATDGTQMHLKVLELMTRIRQKEFKKRTLGKCFFELTLNTKIALNFYGHVMPTKKPSAIKVNAVNNKRLKATQKWLC